MAVGYSVVRNYQTSNYWDPNEVVSHGPGGISIGEVERHNNQINQAATAANAARAYQTTADNAAGELLNNARQGVSDVRAQGAQSQAAVQSALKAATSISDSIGNVNSQAGLLNKRADIINQQAGAVDAYAGKIDATAADVMAEAEALKPYADQLNQYAGQLWNEGTSIFGKGTDIVGLGDQLMNLDDNAGGVIGEYVKNLKSYDPNSKVSLAAADAQKSFDNAKSQLSRELSRSGASGTSGAALAQKRLLTQTYAATLAGAKTRAYQTGLSEQTTVLRNALSDSLAAIKQGTDTQVQGATVQNMGVETTNKAAGVQANVVSGKAAAGNLQKSAADVKTQAGNLQKSAADTMTSAGTLYGKAGDLAAEQASAYSSSASANNSYLSALTSAYGNLTNAYSTYTDYMSSQAQGFAEYATSMGGALFG